MTPKSMSITKLQDLKAKVEAAVLDKVSARRSEVEAEMSKLDGYTGAPSDTVPVTEEPLAPAAQAPLRPHAGQ